MLARHPSGDRMDRVADVHAAILESLVRSRNLVLRPGAPGRTRNDDHLAAYASWMADRRQRSRAPSSPVRRRLPPARAGPNPPARCAGSSGHRIGHELGEDAPRGPTRGAAMISRCCRSQAGHGDGSPCERIEQGDDHRHVGPADRQTWSAQHQGPATITSSSGRPPVPVRSSTARPRRPGQSGVDNARTGKHEWLPRDVPCSLPAATSDPVNVTPR